jgi:hypothetical protein
MMGYSGGGAMAIGMVGLVVLGEGSEPGHSQGLNGRAARYAPWTSEMENGEETCTTAKCKLKQNVHDCTLV